MARTCHDYGGGGEGSELVLVVEGGAGKGQGEKGKHCRAAVRGVVGGRVSFNPLKKLRFRNRVGQAALFQFPPFKKPSFMLVLRVITAKCVMLRCKLWTTNLFRIVDLFTTLHYIIFEINEQMNDLFLHNLFFFSTTI